MVHGFLWQGEEHLIKIHNPLYFQAFRLALKDATSLLPLNILVTQHNWPYMYIGQSYQQFKQLATKCDAVNKKCYRWIFNN